MISCYTLIYSRRLTLCPVNVPLFSELLCLPYTWNDNNVKINSYDTLLSLSLWRIYILLPYIICLCMYWKIKVAVFLPHCFQVLAHKEYDPGWLAVCFLVALQSRTALLLIYAVHPLKWGKVYRWDQPF